jgi:hypothetical protein
MVTGENWPAELKIKSNSPGPEDRAAATAFFVLTADAACNYPLAAAPAQSPAGFLGMGSLLR